MTWQTLNNVVLHRNLILNPVYCIIARIVPDYMKQKKLKNVPYAEIEWGDFF